MSTEQQNPGPALTRALKGRMILPSVQELAATSSLSNSTPRSGWARRPRACVACKESKVRCKRDERRPDDACERCISGGRRCVVSPLVRNKRPRRTVSTVASLESKVDALVAALKVKQSGRVGDRSLESLSPLKPTLDPQCQSAHRSLRRSIILGDDEGPAANFPDPAKYDRPKRTTLLAEHQYSFAFFMPRTPDQDQDAQEDAIDQGIISMEEAEDCFSRFAESMLPHFPVVVFPPETVVSTVRRTRPVLFLAILGAASGHLGESVRKVLAEELMKTYSNRIIMRGEKSLDLVQAIQVSAIWYFPPERFDETKVYQLFHLAASIATELEFGRAARSSKSKLSSIKHREILHSSPETSHLNEPQLECQRALLSCYILCGIAFMITRRPNLMRWTSYMDECIQALEKPDIAMTSDLYLCQWVRAQRIAEEIGQQFCMDDPSANIDVSELSVQYTLRGYEQQINQWKAQIPPEILRPTLQIEASLLNLHLHEIYLHDSRNIKELTHPVIKESRMPTCGVTHKTVNPAHRKALAICITSVRNVFDIFLSFDTDTLCSIPILHYVRVAYTVFSIMKINVATSRLDSDLHEIVENDLNIGFYINALLGSLQEVSQARKLRAAAIFRLVLLMLRTWFQAQKSLTDPDLLPVHRNDTIIHTVLQTADVVIADSNVHSCVSRAHETAFASTLSHVRPVTDDATPSSIDPWSLEQDDEMIPWNEFDFEQFLNTDSSTLLQITLERLGGLVG